MHVRLNSGINIWGVYTVNCVLGMSIMLEVALKFLGKSLHAIPYMRER